MTADWLETLIANSTPVKESKLEQELARKLVRLAYKLDVSKSKDPVADRRKALACGFDLLVAAEYYKGVSHTGWLYCPDQTLMFYPYTNCCPNCVLSNRFTFHESNKLESGKIGTATARLLCVYLKAIFEHNDKQITILQSGEPVDVIIKDDKNKHLFLAEIKASPLLTPPLCASSQRLTAEVDGSSKELGHAPTSFGALFKSKTALFVPSRTAKGEWNVKLFEMQPRADVTDLDWGYRSLISLVDRSDFYREFYAFWSAALAQYHPKGRSTIFWLTNACGSPSPIPVGWSSRRNGGGFESISDSKTSVGIDRTDDIKKGIYQVLKIGSEAKPIPSALAKSGWSIRVGLVTNIHPLRHFTEYLNSIKDILWSIYPKPVKVAKELPPDLAIYNLFDGIISLTDTQARDKWVDETFRF